MSRIYDETRCELGEGALWHPLREQLFWFDILQNRLLTREDGATRTWQFDEHVSAAGWIDAETLLIASETRLFTFGLDTMAATGVTPLEADDPRTRSNDGRADPWGGFWIGTMGKAAEPGLGAIYRLYRGELRQLVGGISISNAICFDRSRNLAYWCDTPTQTVMSQPLHPDTGWPTGPAELFLDLRRANLRPDGAVTDAEGNLWNAQWGAGQVAVYAPDGTFLKAVPVGGSQASCPAFGGPDLTTLYCTTAAEGISPDIRAVGSEGATFEVPGAGRGVPEPAVIL